MGEHGDQLVGCPVEQPLDVDYLFSRGQLVLPRESDVGTDTQEEFVAILDGADPAG